ncbi:MAG: hypothetical protein H0T19_01535 [Thermoleophilaceae bacterium]|nr:hypothetical protein [Thermoleophilaceae bacterium]
MFPRLRQRIGTAIIDRIDLMVELSTLGEYALAEDLRPVAVHVDRPDGGGSAAARRPRDDCPWRAVAVNRRCDDSAHS